MPNGQQNITRGVLDAVRPFLGGPTSDGDAWCFEFGDHLHSNWGAVYGGALAAGLLAVARAGVPDRSPRSLHLQIVRSVGSGPAFATAVVRHSGRTVGTIEVDLFDHRRKLAAVALVTTVNPNAVVSEHHDTNARPQFRMTPGPFVAGVSAPIADSLKLVSERGGEQVTLRAENARPSVDGSSAGGIECTVPWDALDITGPEAACLLADAALNVPLLDSFIPTGDVGPNTDLSLRFTTAPATRVITAAATMLSVQHGTTTVGVEVQAGDQQLAHGLATGLLPRRT
jgi:acyl-coenzyme A thioesterase PaaI-like protein